MGTVVRSTYHVDFSDESLSDAREEMRMRQELRKVIASRLNQRLQSLSKEIEKLGPERFETLQGVCEDFDDLSYESYRYGSVQMYEFLASTIPSLLHRIVLRLFKDLKVSVSKEKLKSAVEWAVFEILKNGVLKGKRKAQIAKEFGHDRAFWSRVSEGQVAKDYKKYLKWVNAQRSQEGDEEQEEDVRVYQKRPDGVITLRNQIPEDTRMFFKSSKGRENMSEKRQDWVKAKQIQRSLGMAKALDFLKKQGATHGSLEKFKREVTQLK